MTNIIYIKEWKDANGGRAYQNQKESEPACSERLVRANVKKVSSYENHVELQRAKRIMREYRASILRPIV